MICPTSLNKLYSQDPNPDSGIGGPDLEAVLGFLLVKEENYYGLLQGWHLMELEAVCPAQAYLGVEYIIIRWKDS